MAEYNKILEEIHAYLDDKAPILFFTLSPNGEIIGANRYAKNFTGRPLTGDIFQDVIIDFKGEFNLSAVVNDASEERLINVSSASGLPQSFYFTFKPAKDAIFAFGRLDAEELETMRKEVLLLNQELNNLTRRLHKTNARLKRLNEEKNRFLGMAAHDLRKPIGLVITYSEFLTDEAESVLSKEHIGFLNTINKSCLFMKRLVDDFLDVSAIEAGKFDLDPQPADIKAVIDRSIELNRLHANKKQIHITVHCRRNAPIIQIDAAKIEQVITNLVSNAIEHSTEGGNVVIDQDFDSDGVTVSVKDFGPGIPPEDIGRLFKPFEKTGVKKTAEEKSTGLGMLITRKIIDAHKGKIWIESQVGQGTIIYFQLPLHKETP